MKTHKMTLNLLRATKDSLRYMEEGLSEMENPDNNDHMMGTIYLRKRAVGKIFGGTFPQRITVTVEVPE